MTDITEVPSPPEAIYYFKVAERAATNATFSIEAFSAVCVDFNHSLKLAEGRLRIDMSKRFYSLIMHYQIHTYGAQSYNKDLFLLSPRLIETSPTVFCVTFDPVKDAPLELQKILNIYMRDCMEVLSW